MEIIVGKYTIKSDRYCYWITETRPVDKTKRRKKTEDGEDEREGRITGYHTNFEDLLEDFAEMRLLTSDAKTVEEALRTIARAQADAKRIAKELPKIRKEQRSRKNEKT